MYNILYYITLKTLHAFHLARCQNKMQARFYRNVGGKLVMTCQLPDAGRSKPTCAFGQRVGDLMFTLKLTGQQSPFYIGRQRLWSDLGQMVWNNIADVIRLGLHSSTCERHDTNAYIITII